MRIGKMWRIFAVSACLLTGLQVFAQNFSIAPNDTIEQSGTLEDLETLTISFQNPDPSPLVLKWQKVSAVVPANWEAAVCDNRICYTGLEDSGTMNAVDSSEWAFLLLHITSKVNYGTATVRYVVWDEKDLLNKDTLTFILRVDEPSGTERLQEAISIHIYPNPSNGMLFIHTNRTNGFFYRITDGAGKSINNGYSETRVLTLLMEGIKAGLYYLGIPDENGQWHTLKFVISP